MSPVHEIKKRRDKLFIDGDDDGMLFKHVVFLGPISNPFTPLLREFFVEECSKDEDLVFDFWVTLYGVLMQYSMRRSGSALFKS